MSALSATDSGAASMTRSDPFAASGVLAHARRAVAAAAPAASISPFSCARARIFSTSSLADWAAFSFGSITRVSNPERADTRAIPRPMTPAPMTVTVRTVGAAIFRSLRVLPGRALAPRNRLGYHVQNDTDARALPHGRCPDRGPHSPPGVAGQGRAARRADGLLRSQGLLPSGTCLLDGRRVRRRGSDGEPPRAPNVRRRLRGRDAPRHPAPARSHGRGAERKLVARAHHASSAS